MAPLVCTGREPRLASPTSGRLRKQMRATSCLRASVQARGERWLSEGPCSDEPPPGPHPSPSALPARSPQRASAHRGSHTKGQILSGSTRTRSLGSSESETDSGWVPGGGSGSECLTGTVSVWEDSGRMSGDGRWGWLRDWERASCSRAAVKVVKMANLWYVYFTAVEKVGVAPHAKKERKHLSLPHLSRVWTREVGPAG